MQFPLFKRNSARLRESLCIHHGASSVISSPVCVSLLSHFPFPCLCFSWYTKRSISRYLIANFVLQTTLTHTTRVTSNELTGSPIRCLMSSSLIIRCCRLPCCYFLNVMLVSQTFIKRVPGHGSSPPNLHFNHQ